MISQIGHGIMIDGDRDTVTLSVRASQISSEGKP